MAFRKSFTFKNKFKFHPKLILFNIYTLDGKPACKNAGKIFLYLKNVSKYDKNSTFCNFYLPVHVFLNDLSTIYFRPMGHNIHLNIWGSKSPKYEVCKYKAISKFENCKHIHATVQKMLFKLFIYDD